MVRKEDMSGFGQRLEDVAARLDERARRYWQSRGAEAGKGFLQTAWANLRDLFTRDVTRDGLRDLVKRDAREAVRFYTREIDFAALRNLPWYKRYPLAAWRVFLSMAFRLNPPRRIAFVIATFAFFLGCWRLAQVSINSEGMAIGILAPGTGWWLLSLLLFALLLLMELRDKLDLKGDLEIAREIQFGLVPSGTFEHGRFVLDHAMRPANTVGGDYYDIIRLDEDRIAAVVADVAGKGMPAALMMALLQGSLHTLITAGLRGPELVGKLNDYLCANIPANRLVTLFYSELDTNSGDLLYVNAGHNAPILLRSDLGIERLDSTAVVLGFVRQSLFEAKSVRLDPGSRLVLYTDGIVEAFDSAGEEYGDARLEAYLKTHAGLRNGALIDGLIRDVVTFCADSRPGDDMTVLVIESRSLKPDAEPSRAIRF
jgi:sigma-B regulation protein RsbU (phosphoserine phosphatase)